VNINRDVYDEYFINLYDQYFRRVVKFLLKYVNDFNLAEDLAHDIFIKFYQKKRRISGDESMVRSYIFKSAKNIAIDYSRKQKRDEKNFMESLTVIDTGDDNFTSRLEEFIIEGEIISTVEDVLLEFPERSRRLFLEIAMEGKNMKKVSREENVSGYFIRKLYLQIRDTIRERLDKSDT